MKLFGIDCGSGKLSDQLFYLTYGLMTKAGFICWGGGGGPGPSSSPSATSQTQTVSSIAPWAQPGVSSLISQEMANMFPNQTTNPDGSINLGQQLGYTAFGQNGVGIGPGQMQAAQAAVAPTSALQNQTYQEAAGLQTPSQYGQATGLAGAAGTGSLNTVGQANMYGNMGAQYGASYGQNATNPAAVQSYMNPYLSATLAPSLALQQQQFGQLGAQEQGAATQANAFGGGREAVMQGLNQQNEMLAQNQLVSNAYNNAYNTANTNMQQAATLGMQGAATGLSGINAQQAGYAGAGTQASNLANIGTQNLAAQTSILGTQNTMGAQQQAQQQAVINQAIQNYANTQNYPMQQAYNLEGLYTGTGATANQTQTQYQAAPSLVNTAAGLGTAAIGASKLLATNKKGGQIKGFAAGGIASLATGGSAPADTSDSGSSLAGASLQAMFNTFVNGPQSAIDAQLQSKTPSMEQTAAMLANQKRKELQTAAQGQQAGMQAQQPTVKDQMLAQDMAKRQAALQQMYGQQPEPQQLQAQPAAQQQQMAQNPVKEEGLDQLPAPTLKTMAGGGIIAFDEGTKDKTVGAAANSQTQTDPNALYIPPVSDTDKKIWSAITHPADTLQSVKDWMYSDPQSKMVSKAQSGTLTQADIDAASAPAATAPAALSEANQSKFTPSQLDQAISNNAGIGKPAAGPANAPAGGIKDLTTARSPQPPVPAPAPQPTFTPAPDRFADMAMTQEAMDKKVASEKNSATADYFMNMGFKMATTVGPLGKAIGEGGIAALPGLAASRKTINELEKQRQDFNFNVAKAQEAKQNGDEQLAFHYAKQADDKANQMGMLAVHNRMADADMIKASAMANSVGSKADIIQQRTDAAVLKAASDIHDKNMANMLFQQKFAKMSPMERNQYFNDVRGQARSLAGQDNSIEALVSGIPKDAVDAAIAKKSKS